MVNIDTIRTDLFLVHLNDLEVAVADVGCLCLYGFTEEKIYMVSGPDCGEW